MRGGEAQGGGPGAVGAFALTGGDTGPGDRQERQHAGGVTEPLGLALGPRQVVDLGEPQVPAPVLRRVLRMCPQLVEVGADPRLHEQPHAIP